MSIRFRLIATALVLLLPALGALAWGVWATWRTGHVALDRQGGDSARTMALSLDREFTRYGAIARALAASPLLDQAPRLTEHEREAFDRAVRRAIQGSPVSVELVSESVRWIDTRWQPGSPPRSLGAGGAALWRSAGVHALAASGPEGAGVVVVEPVFRSGTGPLMNLKVVLTPADLRRLMEQRAPNAGWSTWLLDPRGQVVLRHPAAAPGSRDGPLDAWVRESLAGRAEGRFALRSVGGEPLRVYFSRAPQGWTALTTVPRAQLDAAFASAPAQRLLAAFVLLALAAGALLWMARAELRRQLAATAARTRREERLAAGRERVQALGRLTARVAHEFNNLLGVISNSAYLMERQSTQPTLAMPIAATLRAVEAASRLTGQLLRFGGQRPAQPRTLALHDWLPNLREMLGVVLGRRIELSIDVPDEGLCVRADPDALELAIVDLALDAREALPDGGRVHLGTERAAPALVAGLPAGRYLSITLRGNGPGVAAALSLPREKDPAPLVLPLVPVAPPQARESEPVPAGCPPLRARVLLTEDNEALGDVTAAMLETMGARVERAAHAGQALDRLERGPAVDVLLSDVNMPGALDGLGLARTVRQRWPAVHVVLISAQGPSLGPGDDFPVLRKPCPPAVLMAALRREPARDRWRAAGTPCAPQGCPRAKRVACVTSVQPHRGHTAMDQKSLINCLNDLIETCKDGEYGFRRTAEHLHTADLQSVFAARAEECKQAASELQALVVQLGGNAQDHGSVAGAAHRGWVAVKGTLAGYSDVNMLEEAERGEDVAIERYREALAKDLPPDVRVVVERQYEGAKRNHMQVRALRDQARAMAD